MKVMVSIVGVIVGIVLVAGTIILRKVWYAWHHTKRPVLVINQHHLVCLVQIGTYEVWFCKSCWKPLIVSAEFRQMLHRALEIAKEEQTPMVDETPEAGRDESQPVDVKYAPDQSESVEPPTRPDREPVTSVVTIPAAFYRAFAEGEL